MASLMEREGVGVGTKARVGARDTVVLFSYAAYQKGCGMRAGRCGKCGRVLDHVGECGPAVARGSWGFGVWRMPRGDWEYEGEEVGDLVRERRLTCWVTGGEGCATCVALRLPEVGSTYGRAGTL